MLCWSCPALLWVLLLASLSWVHGRDLFMDSPTACGQSFSVGDEDIIVRPRGSVSVSNPPTDCVIYLESSYSSSNYKFEIIVEAASFQDCAMTLRIFDGPSVAGTWIRMLGCGTSTSTGQFYSKDRQITLHLTRSRIEYVMGSDFMLRIKVYKAVDGPDEFLGTGKIPAGAIIGIVLGFIVLIAFCILLGWCYKTGRLSGFGQDYPSTAYKAKPENLSKSGVDSGEGINGPNNAGLRTWHNTETKSNMSDSRSNFDLDDTRIWDSLTNVGASKKILNNDPAGGRNVTQGRFAKKEDNFIRSETTNMSSSPRSRNKVNEINQGRGNGNNRRTENDRFDRGELGLRGNGRRHIDDGIKNSLLDEIKKKRSSGLFENPDQEGYLYDYDQVKKLSGDKDIIKPSTPDVKPSTPDFETELKDAVKRNSMKRLKSENQSDSAPGGPSSESGGEFDKVKFQDDSEFSSNPALNKKTDGDTTGPDAQSSPKPTKKKRKKSPKSTRKHKHTDENEVPESPKSRHKTIDEERDLPPEIFAPIFLSEEPNTQDYPSNQYQPGYQGSYPPAQAYDPNNPMGAYPPGMPGFYPGAPPYQQAGQAQWFVENQNGQQKIAFAMQTHSQSEDSMNDRGDPGLPGYTSTPYYSNQYGAPQGYGPQDMALTPGGPGMNNSMVPAGTILDDPRVPPPGTSVARYSVDPRSGIKAAQVIWTDAKRDPTDPPPGEDNPQITRKTITRLTTKSNDDRNNPDAPKPSLQDMSYRTAQQIQASGQEPAFMSPSRQHPQSAIQYQGTPERSNASYYTPSHHAPQHIPGSPAPVVHDAPWGNQAFKDNITLKNDFDV